MKWPNTKSEEEVACDRLFQKWWKEFQKYEDAIGDKMKLAGEIK